MVRIVCWNTNRKQEPWRPLRGMDADLALVQEACSVPSDVASHIDAGPRQHWDPATWNTDYWKGRRFSKLSDRQTMVAKLSDRVRVEWFKQIGPISTVKEDEIAVSGIGTIAAARVVPVEGEPAPLTRLVRRRRVEMVAVVALK